MIARAADPSAELFTLASKGKTEEVKALVDGGASVEAKDKKGRTALMLAAQHGRVETVKYLLSKGAKTGIQDKSGDDAYTLTVFSPEGHGDHHAVLDLLPKPPRPRVALEVKWAPAQVASSCFMTREQLIPAVDAVHVDDIFLKEFGSFMQTSGRQLIQIVDESPQTTAKVEIQPGVACVTESGDRLTLYIEMQLVGAGDKKVYFQKTLGTGLKGLGVQVVPNSLQYAPVFEKWIKPQAEPLYWAIAQEAMRHQIGGSRP